MPANGRSEASQRFVEVGLELDAKQILERLSAIEVLRALPPEEVHSLVQHVRQLEVPASAPAMEVGERGDALYFIESGTVRVRRPGEPELVVGPGSVVGEAALLTGRPRSATVVAESDLVLWRIGKVDFDAIVAASPNLRNALEVLVQHRAVGTAPPVPSRAVWVAVALRAREASSRQLPGWRAAMYVGIGMWALRIGFERLLDMSLENLGPVTALWNLIAGLLVIQGSCEAFIHGVERLGARLSWDGFISGTVGSLLSTAPEFFVIAFLVQVDPLAAFVTAVVTIFNNALAFSIYSFFLPKDAKGAFAMPRSMAVAGGEILVAGGAVSLVVGIVMLVLRVERLDTGLVGPDLIGIGAVLLGIYGYYLVTLIRYYAEGRDDAESLPPDPERLGHDVRVRGIATLFGLGIFGAYAGGESIGDFAAIALEDLGLPTIPTAAALAFFAGISEYVIVVKSHRRGELGIALSNVFGGIAQVMFLLLPFGLVVIGALGVWTGDPKYAVPVDVTTLLLVLLLFPVFYALNLYMSLDERLSDLDAAGMTGIYLLLLYFLFTSPGR